MSKIVPIMDSLPKPIVNEKKPRKVNKSKTQPQVHFVVDEIKSNTSPKKIKIPSIFKEICDCDPDAFELGFGKFGLDLKDFIDILDNKDEKLSEE
jgi:hypothetical protein